MVTLELDFEIENFEDIYSFISELLNESINKKLNLTRLEINIQNN